MNEILHDDNVLSNAIELQRGELVARIIGLANELWLMTSCKRKVDQSMLSIKLNSQTFDIESGEIGCLLCSESFKLNITKKKNANDNSINYVSLSNYKMHILKTHTKVADSGHQTNLKQFFKPTGSKSVLTASSLSDGENIQLSDGGDK